ncbi:MAG: hypothetical protein CMB11_04865 [Euryarchaeota archaeon]|nr:hypothetical protein [Euryarchaeota archaeon]
MHTLRSFVVNQPSVPCWPSERLTQFLMPAFSTACSRCWLSKARLDLHAHQMPAHSSHAALSVRMVGSLEDQHKLAVREDGHAPDGR